MRVNIKERLTATEQNRYFIYDKYDGRLYITKPHGQDNLTVAEVISTVHYINVRENNPMRLFTIIGETEVSLRDVYYVPEGATYPVNFWDVLRETISSQVVRHQHYHVVNVETNKWLNYMGEAVDFTEADGLTIWEMLPLIINNPTFSISSVVTVDGDGRRDTLKGIINSLMNKREWLRNALSEAKDSLS